MEDGLKPASYGGVHIHVHMCVCTYMCVFSSRGESLFSFEELGNYDISYGKETTVFYLYYHFR